MASSPRSRLALYRGEIDKPELTTAIHRSLLLAVRMQEQALTPDEFRRWNTLDPGDDPMLALAPPGVEAGDVLPDEPGPPDTADPTGTGPG